MGRYTVQMTRKDKALAFFDCPDCGAKKGRTCTSIYRGPLCKYREKNYSCHSSRLHETMRNAGLPIKIAHNGRMSLLWKAESRQEKRQRVQQLRDWLRKYGDIFNA